MTEHLDSNFPITPKEEAFRDKINNKPFSYMYNGESTSFTKAVDIFYKRIISLSKNPREEMRGSGKPVSIHLAEVLPGIKREFEEMIIERNKQQVKALSIDSNTFFQKKEAIRDAINSIIEQHDIQITPLPERKSSVTPK